jgi:hypothetical protein
MAAASAAPACGTRLKQVSAVMSQFPLSRGPSSFPMDGCRVGVLLLVSTLVSRLDADGPDWLATATTALERVEAAQQNVSVEVTQHSQKTFLGQAPSDREFVKRFIWNTCGDCLKTSQLTEDAPKPSLDVVANDKYFFAIGFEDQGVATAMVDLGRRDELQFDPRKQRRSV